MPFSIAFMAFFTFPLRIALLVVANALCVASKCFAMRLFIGNIAGGCRTPVAVAAGRRWRLLQDAGGGCCWTPVAVTRRRPLLVIAAGATPVTRRRLWLVLQMLRLWLER